MKVKAQVFTIGCALKALLMEESYPFYSPQKYIILTNPQS